MAIYSGRHNKATQALFEELFSFMRADYKELNRFDLVVNPSAKDKIALNVYVLEINENTNRQETINITKAGHDGDINNMKSIIDIIEKHSSSKIPKECNYFKLSSGIDEVIKLNVEFAVEFE